jgi:iron complex transport system permease protein
MALATAPHDPLDPLAASEQARDVAPTRLRWPAVAVVAIALVGAFTLGVLVGPAGLPGGDVVRALLDRLPLIDMDSGLTAGQEQVLFQVRLPRVVLAGLVGAMLAGGGAAYQGVFRNPLADPYLLGVAAGGGLGATLAIVYGPGRALLPLAAFIGGALAVTITYVVGASVGRDRSNATIVLAGVAVTSFFTALQTYVQLQHTDTLREVYTWILGRFTTAGWDDVRLILPYAMVSAVGLILHRRLLDVLRVGEEEAGTLGVPIRRLRLTIVALATLGTAAAVAVSGLIGFVGIIVPHTVRLLAGASYRIVVPLSLAGGAAFLIFADVLARTLDAPAELPIGVITAFFGAPFFLIVLRARRRV